MLIFRQCDSMIKNNRNNEQIYGRNDMIMLDPNNKIYGSLGLADKYVMKTEEGTRLVLNNPKQGRFGDVLTEFNMYGRSEQFSTTGAQLFNENIEIKNRGVTIKINGSTVTFKGTVSDESSSRVNFQKKIILKPGKYTASSSNKKIFADFSVKKANDKTIYSSHIEIDGTEEEVRVRVLFGERPSAKGDVINGTTNIMVNEGDIVLPYEPYTGGKPSPSPEYPQEIKSVVNPTVKVSSEDGLKVQSVTFLYTLNAVPVSSGGNVTINGQQLVCDEVDLERGVKVQRVGKLEMPDTVYGNFTSVNAWDTSGTNKVQPFRFGSIRTVPKSMVICTALPRVEKGEAWGKAYECIGYVENKSGKSFIDFYIANERLGTTAETTRNDAFKALMKWFETNSFSFIYALATPIETPLTPAEIATFNAFTTYYPVTIIENNYNTWMKATYKSTESV